MGRDEVKEVMVTEVPKTLEEAQSTLNQYIPLFVAKTPWYLTDDHHSLKQSDDVLGGVEALDKWYDRGQKTGIAATKYRKGACENCGAATHKTKDCMDRPRKKGAKWTGKNIQRDEFISESKGFDGGFDAKRDRWNGYNSVEQLQNVREWGLVEEKRRTIRELKAKELAEVKAQTKVDRADKGLSSESESEEDEEKYAQEAEHIGQNVNTLYRKKQTVRNLRMREDTAKYLRNLDLDSAHYDPKTRAMNENPYDSKDPKDVDFAGDNFDRYTGQVSQVSQIKKFAWEAEQRGANLTLEANPTQGELLFKQYQSKTSEVKSAKKDSVLSKYGGEEYLSSIPEELLLGQTENYVEYSVSGEIIKGNEKVTKKSRYPEDIVWGSYYNDHHWGYACCHATTISAYCGGQTSIDAENNKHKLLKFDSKKAEIMTLNEQNLLNSKTEGSRAPNPLKATLGGGRLEFDRVKLAEALAMEKERKGEVMLPIVKKKRKFSERMDGMSQEELEAYRLTKHRAQDPMAKFIDPEK